MTIENILKKIHRKVSKDTDYPTAGSEVLLVRLDYVDDAIDEYEDCAREGYAFKELITSDTLVFGGTGTDALPLNFLAFVRRFDSRGENFRAELYINSTLFVEVSSAEGSRLIQEGQEPNVFWREGANIRTLPAVSGSITLPYLKTHTRYTTGSEATEPEMENDKFIEDYVTAKEFLDNSDDILYQSFANSASEKLATMKYNALS